MKFLFTIIFSIHLLFSSGCKSSASPDNPFKETLPISSGELQDNQGDCFYFKDSLNNYFTGTVMNFHKSDDGIWYGICFNDYYDAKAPTKTLLDSLRFCGRKVMYFSKDQYIIGFDISWVRDTVVDLNKQGLLGNIDLSGIENVNISAQGNAMNFKEFAFNFHLSKNNRHLPPDNYWEIKEHLRTDEYFTLKQITDWYKNFTPRNKW